MNDWYSAILLRSDMISRDIRSMVFSIPGFSSFRAGQYCDFRLSSDDGYQAQRSYSIASSPSEFYMTNEIEFAVQILPNGEVSSFLDTLHPGDKVEIKGPIGGHFVWEKDARPIMLVGAGSGFAPLMSILREFVASKVSEPIYVIGSFRSIQDIPWYEELLTYNLDNPNLNLHIQLTREWPEDWDYRKTGQIDADVFCEIFNNWKVEADTVHFICGRNPFVNIISRELVDLGFGNEVIKTERYGE